MSSLIAPLFRGRVHYAWIVVAVTFLMMLTVAGIRSTPGVLIVPLEQEFGWDRAQHLPGDRPQLLPLRPVRPVRGGADGARRHAPR